MKSTDYVNLIDETLRSMGIPKKDFCEKTGITSATLSQWRKGIYKPSEDKFNTINAFLHFDLIYADLTFEKNIPVTISVDGDEATFLRLYRALSKAEKQSIIDQMSWMKERKE